MLNLPEAIYCQAGMNRNNGYLRTESNVTIPKLIFHPANIGYCRIFVDQNERLHDMILNARIGKNLST